MPLFLAAPVLLLALRGGSAATGLTGGRKYRGKKDKNTQRAGAKAAAAATVSPAASPPASPLKVRNAARLAAEALREMERERDQAETEEAKVLSEADKRVCWAYYFWHVLGHPDESEWDQRGTGTMSLNGTSVGPVRILRAKGSVCKSTDK
jgi:hypothetical protein